MMKKSSQSGSSCITEDEEKLPHLLLPQQYIDNNLNKNLDADYALRFMQNELNFLLNSFLNGGFSARGYIIYPLIKDVSSDNITRIRRLKNLAIFLDKNGFDFKNSIKKSKNRIGAWEFASRLSALYMDFNSIKSGGISKKKPSCRELDLREYSKSDSSYLKPLQELKDYANKNLKQYLAGFYLHGSLATKDYIKGWSDVDTFGIVSESSMNNPKSLIELRDRICHIRYFFHKVDPLQHHGAILASECDFGNYCPAYFPLQVLKYAKSFFGHDEPIKYDERDFSNEALARLHWFVKYFRNISEKGEISLNSYDAKTLLHSVTLFPTLYLQAKGIIVYKKFSFDIAKKDFSRDCWKAIDNASLTRNKWKRFPRLPLADFLSKINPLLFYQLNFRVIDLVRSSGMKNNINAGSIAKGMLGLSEEAWKKVRKNAIKQI